MNRFAIRFCNRVSVAALLAAALAVVVAAQSTGGRINGRVTDPTGKIWDEVWGHTGKG